jgi:hypothetical protein
MCLLMTKFDKKELFMQMEEAVKDLENITIDDPGPSIEYQDMRHKNMKKYLEKLIKKNDESKNNRRVVI